MRAFLSSPRLSTVNGVVAGEAGSLQFPGGTLSNASGRIRVQRDGGAACNIGGAGTVFTVEMWIRPSSVAADNNRTVTEGVSGTWTNGNIFLDSSDSSSGQGFVLGLSAGQLYFGLDVNADANNYTAVGTTDLRDGNWHHVAAYTDRSSGLIELFVDGTREESVTNAATIGSVAYTGAATAGDQHRHIFGIEKLQLTGGLNGSIAMPRFSTNRRYNGATYTVPTAPFTPDGNTVLLLYLNENTGTTAADSSGNNSTGTLAGTTPPTWSTADPFGGT